VTDDQGPRDGDPVTVDPGHFQEVMKRARAARAKTRELVAESVELGNLSADLMAKNAGARGKD
jgi:hypothetical protein